MQNKNNKQNKGYTIIETMIAISIFLVVVMIGMTALLNANLIHQKSQNMRSIMDNLSFIMEDMSKNMRTGYNYHCILDINNLSNLYNSLSCPNGGGLIAFESANGSSSNNSDQWVYRINNGDIEKSIDSGNSFIKLNIEGEVIIDPVASSFTVVGAEPSPGDTQQPFVTIRLVGNITYRNVITPFSLQTSVSQRLIDVVP